MTVKELQEAVDAAKGVTGDALQIIYDALNAGQRKKLLKDDTVYALLRQYEVIL